MLDRELVFTVTVPYCKGWTDGSVPEGSNEEEEYSSDRVVRPFRTAMMAFITLAYRQFGLEKLIVFLHDYQQVNEMLMFEYEGSTLIAGDKAPFVISFSVWSYGV